MQNKTLKKELIHVQDNILDIINTMHSAHKAMITSTVLNSREYQYMMAVNKLLENLLVKRLPGIKERLKLLSLSAWRNLNEEGVVPGVLFNYLQDVLKPGDKNK